MEDYHFYKIAISLDDALPIGLVLSRVAYDSGIIMTEHVFDEEMEQLGYGEEYDGMVYVALTLEEADILFRFMNGCGFKYVVLVNPPIEEATCTNSTT